ncbi:hypothetical protein SteCoe_6041 [Stentor coeruleus]|uniref:Major facilitator superfamily (MFS) profile domain-containing protein n=1 Tax=Stentor coeruleus TaxID=5963 RepID=A0A1R2CR18_9CILI|nr:hypothetical protein SteCoe_6041 [Stentor coeruleus]
MASWFNSAGEIHKQLQISSENLGMIDMSFLLSLAFGNLIFGILGDKYQQKKVLCFCSFLACLVYSMIILFGYLQVLTITGFTVLFALLGLFESSIYPMTVAIMGQVYSYEKRGRIIGIWSINAATGDIAGYFLSSLILDFFKSWVIVSLISLGIFFLVFLITYWLMESLPRPETKPQIAIIDALRLPTVINYCLCYSCIKLLHMAILIWIPYYLEVELDMNFSQEGILMILYSLGGVIGSVTSGILSDHVSDRSYILLIMLSLSFPIINILGFELGTSTKVSFGISFIIGGLISGGSTLLSAVVAADMCDLETKVEAKSTLTGLVDAFGGFGASLGQFAIGRLQEYSWSAVFGLMLVANFLGIAALAPVAFKAFRNRKYKEFS